MSINDKGKTISTDLPSDILRYRLLEILAYTALNTCQICRCILDRDKNDIDFCRTTKVRIRGLSNFKRFGARYEHCKDHGHMYNRVYSQLKLLVKRGKIVTIKLRFNDPQKSGKHWDTMRFWGKPANLEKITKQTLPHYFNLPET